jgi:hypothetical protein
MNILFAFKKKDPSLRLENLRETIKDPPDTFHVPDPSALSIRPALRKLLSISTAHLIKDLAGFVVVGIFLGNFVFFGLGFLGGWTGGDPKLLRYSLEDLRKGLDPFYLAIKCKDISIGFASVTMEMTAVVIDAE